MGVGDEEEEDEGENLFGDDMENDYRQGEYFAEIPGEK